MGDKNAFSDILDDGLDPAERAELLGMRTDLAEKLANAKDAVAVLADTVEFVDLLLLGLRSSRELQDSLNGLRELYNAMPADPSFSGWPQ